MKNLLASDNEAIRFLVLARQLWTSAGIEYHAARVRLELARILMEAGDIAAARTEIAAAERIAVRIGSRRLQMMAAEMQPQLTSTPPSHLIAQG